MVAQRARGRSSRCDRSAAGLNIRGPGRFGPGHQESQ